VLLDHDDIGMSKDQYLRMCEQTGEEIDWKKCPPEMDDFPNIIIDILNVFHSMGDRIYPEIGYIGKDYTNLDLLLNMYNIGKHNLEYAMELLLWLDSRAIKNSQDKLKAEWDKIKNKHG